MLSVDTCLSRPLLHPLALSVDLCGDLFCTLSWWRKAKLRLPVPVSVVVRSCVWVRWCVEMVVRFVCVIRVPVCARAPRVAVCVPCVSPGSPLCLFTGTGRRTHAQARGGAPAQPSAVAVTIVGGNRASKGRGGSHRGRPSSESGRGVRSHRSAPGSAPRLAVRCGVCVGGSGWL